MRAVTHDLVRFGVAMEGRLLEELDDLVRERGSTRSEVLRDLVRKEVAGRAADRGGEAVAAMTLVYDHHVRDLSDKLTDLQHDLGDAVRSSMHVHLSHALCLEVVVMRGPSDLLRDVAARTFATRGVKHGGLELFAALETTAEPGHGHGHAHGAVAAPRKAKAKARPEPTARAGRGGAR